MDPISMALGVAISAGAIFMDLRGASLIKEYIENQMERQAKVTTLVIDQPTEQYIINFDEKL